MTALLSGFPGFDGTLDESLFDEELLDSNGNYEEEILEEEIEPGEVLDTIDEDQLPWECQGFDDQEEDIAQLLDTEQPELEIPTTEEVEDEGQIPVSLINAKYTWIGSVESWIERHELHCGCYVPGSGQVRSGPVSGTCCFSLVNNTELLLEVDYSQIIIRNAYTSNTIGRLPDSYSKVLLPLATSGLLNMTGRIGSTVHIANALPPFLLEIRIDFDKTTSADDEQATALRQLRAWLKRPKGRFIEPILPKDIAALRKRLRVKPSKSAPLKRNIELDAADLSSHSRPAKRRSRDFEAMFGARSLGTSSVPNVQKTAAASINEILETRRRARAKKQVEECRERDLPLVLNGVREAADKEYDTIYRRYDYESCRKRCMGDHNYLGRLLWQHTVEGNAFLRERVSGSVAAFFACKDPLSALGRLLGASRAVRDRSREYCRCRGATETERSFGSADVGVLDGLAKAWRRVSSPHSEPVLSAPLSEAVLHLVGGLDNERLDIVELRKSMAI